DLTTRFLEALIEGIHRMKRDRPFALKVIERHLRINDAETLQIAYDYNIPPLPAVPYVNLKGIKLLLDAMVESNPKAARLRPKDIGDNDPLREIEGSGLVRQIEGAAAADRKAKK